MSSTPLPSQLCLLSSLPSRNVGDKVRFLGCVASYSTATAALTLEHDYPAGTSVSTLVDVKLVLETLNSDQTRVGEWVNVIGYVASAVRPAGTKPADSRGSKVPIQAVLLWSAGPLDVQRYENILNDASG